MLPGCEETLRTQMPPQTTTAVICSVRSTSARTMPTRSMQRPSGGSTATSCRSNAGRLVPRSRP